MKTIIILVLGSILFWGIIDDSKSQIPSRQSILVEIDLLDRPIEDLRIPVYKQYTSYMQSYNKGIGSKRLEIVRPDTRVEHSNQQLLNQGTPLEVFFVINQNNRR